MSQDKPAARSVARAKPLARSIVQADERKREGRKTTLISIGNLSFSRVRQHHIGGPMVGWYVDGGGGVF